MRLEIEQDWTILAYIQRFHTDALKLIIIPKLSLMRGLFTESIHNSSI